MCLRKIQKLNNYIIKENTQNVNSNRYSVWNAKDQCHIDNLELDEARDQCFLLWKLTKW